MSTTTPAIRLTSPPDVLSVVPHLLGYEVTRSLVLICLSDSTGDGKTAAAEPPSGWPPGWTYPRRVRRPPPWTRCSRRSRELTPTPPSSSRMPTRSPTRRWPSRSSAAR